MSRDELLARLARLDARDRTWLLGELPPALRRGLIEELAGEDAVTAEPTPLPTRAGGWEALDAERLAAILAVEPVWLVSAATRGTDERWRERFLATLSHRRRHEIEMADRIGRPLNARAARVMLEACRQKLANGGAGANTAAVRGFAALVEQMKARFA